MQYNLGLDVWDCLLFQWQLLEVLRSTQLTKHHQTQFCAV